MLKRINWDDQIGRRLRLRELHVFFTVAQHRSMSKAAVQLGVSTPTVSEVIAGLEHVLGVQLLDRSPKGVEPTMYGRALLKRALIVFDELKQAIKDIEYLADPTTGEVKVACPLGVAYTVIPQIFERFVKENPHVALQFDEATAAATTREFRELRDRKYDVILGRAWLQQDDEPVADDLNVEFLFDDPVVIAAGAQSKWAARRGKISLAELVDAQWIMPGPQTWNHRNLAEACRARGLAMPRGSLMTLSISVITHFLVNGDFITTMPRSVAYCSSVKILSVDFSARPWSVNIVTLKNRTLNPAVARFIECARDVTRRMREGRPGWHTQEQRRGIPSEKS
jgi:DNA-binding transcriptional LysR family regulator